jgi:hypothetical protein
MAVHGDPEEIGGTAAGPLAGECVPHEGERTAVERMRDGASLAQTAALSLASASGGGPARARLALSIRTACTKATPAVAAAR